MMNALSGRIGSIIEDVNKKNALAININRYENSSRKKFYMNTLKRCKEKNKI